MNLEAGRTIREPGQLNAGFGSINTSSIIPSASERDDSSIERGQKDYKIFLEFHCGVVQNGSEQWV